MRSEGEDQMITGVRVKRDDSTCSEGDDEMTIPGVRV
jgi:hypothetical protein